MKFLDVGILFGIISTVLGIYDPPGRTTYFINGEFYILNNEGDDLPSPTDYLNNLPALASPLDPPALTSLTLPDPAASLTSFPDPAASMVSFPDPEADLLPLPDPATLTHFPDPAVALHSIPLPIRKSIIRIRNMKRKNAGKARLRSGFDDIPLNLKSDEVDNTIRVDEKNKATYRRMPDNDNDDE